MAEGGELLIIICSIIFICICIFYFSTTVNEVNNRGKYLGNFDLDDIPLPPKNSLHYLVCGYSQAGSSHGIDKEFIEFDSTIKHLKTRLNKSSMFSTRVYVNEEKNFMQYHRGFYDGRGKSEGRKLGKVIIFYSQPESQKVVNSNKNNSLDTELSLKKDVIESHTRENEPLKDMDSDIILEFVGERKYKETISKLIDQEIYIAKLVVDDDLIRLIINDKQVARVSAKTKKRALNYIQNIGCYVKVLVWNTESLPASIHMLCHRGEHRVKANYK